MAHSNSFHFEPPCQRVRLWSRGASCLVPRSRHRTGTIAQQRPCRKRPYERADATLKHRGTKWQILVQCLSHKALVLKNEPISGHLIASTSLSEERTSPVHLTRAF